LAMGGRVFLDLHQENTAESCRCGRLIEAGMSLDINVNKHEKEWRQSKTPNEQKRLARMASNCKQENRRKMTLLKSHICKPRVSKCSYETHTMRTQAKQAKSYRNTMAPHRKWSASSSHRFDCKPNGRSPLEKFVPSTGPNKFSYGYFWVAVGSQIPGPVPSGLVCFGNPKTIAFYPRRLKGDRLTLEVQEKSP